MKISDLEYTDQFYWKGKRYKQIIRPKNPHGKFSIYCAFAYGESPWFKMPAGRQVKPIITAKPVLKERI